MSSDDIRSLLESSGYEVRFREDEWVDCLITGDGGAWLGSGLDRASAFDAAVRLACPGPLAARLIAAVAGRSAPLPATESPRAPGPEEAPSGESPAPPPRPSLPTLAVRAPSLAPPAAPRPSLFEAPPIEPRAPGQIAVIVSRPSPLRAAPGAVFPMPTPNGEGRSTEPRPIVDVEEALEELDILLERIRDSREELGLCAPDRQRLAMLGWICLARAHTDSFPDDVRVRDRVTSISRLLTEIGKTFWPGSVTALQLHMQPRDLPRHLLGGVATTWRRAAELAEQALRNKEHEDERRGYDAYGWADTTATAPHPVDPPRLLLELVAEVESLSGPIDLQAAPADTTIRPDTAIFQRWVRQLRWLRGSPVDPERWARLAGRFRWWAFRREPALQPAARELEPTYMPTQPWAHLLGGDPAQLQHDESLRDALSGSPASEAREQVVHWLLAALPFGDTHHGNIVELARPVTAVILELTAEELGLSDRRLRRRLGRLQEDLRAGTTEVAPAPLPSEPEDVLRAAATNGHELPEWLLDRVRLRTAGKRSVFVSHRRDPELQARLQAALRFETLDLRIAETRRVQQLGEAIAEDRYDFVLAATGFQSHALDTVLARACRQAGVEYVRVHLGEPLSCLRAIARERTA